MELQNMLETEIDSAFLPLWGLGPERSALIASPPKTLVRLNVRRNVTRVTFQLRDG